MSVQIVVPSLGESVTEATVAKWLKEAGQPVRIDEPLVELETDKINLEVSATASGVLGSIEAAAGSNVEVGAVLGVIDEAAAAAAPAARTPVDEHGPEPAKPAGDGGLTEGDALASPAAAPAAVEPAPRSAGAREERAPMTRLRQRIAERLKEAQNTAAMLTTFNEVDMSGVMAVRDRLRDAFEKKHGVRLGFMSFFVKAVLVALKEIPAVNAEIDGSDIVYKNHYDIGVAVGANQGLVVPVLRDADRMSFAGIETGIAALGKRARDGKLTIEDLTGGTFTITNGGVYGSLQSTPILNPPQSGILGMHKIQKRPVAIDDELAIRPMMYLALSYDHRIVDGREAVTFLVCVKDCIEDPQRILLET